MEFQPLLWRHTKSSTRQNSGVLRVFNGNAGAFTRISSVNGGKFLMKQYLHIVTHNHHYALPLSLQQHAAAVCTLCV